MAEWHRVAKIDDLADGRSLACDYDGESVALFNVEGEIFAVSNQCPHAGGRLVEGFIEEGRVVCPWHAWSFPLSPKDPPNDGLCRYGVRIVGDEIEIQELAMNRNF